MFRNVVTISLITTFLVGKADLRRQLGDIAGEARTHWRVLVLGAVGTLTLQSLVMQSLHMVHATNLAVMSQMTPPFLFVISGFILRTERPTWGKFGGMLLSIGGAIVLIDPTSMVGAGMNATEAFGNAICVFIAFLYAVLILISKRTAGVIPGSVLQLIFVSGAFPGFVSLAWGLGALSPSAIVWTGLSVAGAATVGVCAAFDYVLTFTAAGYVSSLVCGLANTLLPIFVGIATFFINHEQVPDSHYSHSHSHSSACARTNDPIDVTPRFKMHARTHAISDK